MRSISHSSRVLVSLLLIVVLGSFFVSCTISPEAIQIFLDQALIQGIITPEQARLIREAANSFQIESRPFTYEEEYAIGRVVAAAVFSQYAVYDQPELTAYVNKIGQGLAFLSARPLLPEGYHIVILDSQEVLAFAAPGGFVLITRGLLRLAESEGMLAALLAHEISHTALGHGLVSLASYRMGDLAMYYAALSTQRTNADNKETAALFSAAVHDFVSLISVQGYSQTMEYEADFHALRMLHEANYDPAALEAFIQALGTSNDENARQYSNQHPLPSDRIARLNELRQRYAQQDTREKALRAIREASQFDPGYPASERSVLERSREVGNNTSGRVAPLEYTRRERFAHMRLLF